MIARFIKRKALTPHHIIRAEMGAAPIIIETLFQSVTCIDDSGAPYMKVLKICTYVMKATC